MLRSKTRGFSLVEILIVLGLMGILATVVLMNFSGSDTGTKEQTLKANLAALRQAVDLYKSDHGRFPSTTGDWSSNGNSTRFIRQMTEFTRADGQASTTKSTTYKYGPYLKAFPEDPFTNTTTVSIDTSNERLLSAIAAAVASGSGAGGWYYEAKSGNICANLGSAYPSEYASY